MFVKAADVQRREILQTYLFSAIIDDGRYLAGVRGGRAIVRYSLIAE